MNGLFSLNPEFDLFLIGQQTSGIDINGNGEPLKNTQHVGYGFRVSSKVSKKIEDKFAVFLEPFVKYWNIANSDFVDGYLEPKNNTVEYGVKIGITF
jgi:hypothetical protein